MTGWDRYFNLHLQLYNDTVVSVLEACLGLWNNFVTLNQVYQSLTKIASGVSSSTIIDGNRPMHPLDSPIHQPSSTPCCFDRTQINWPCTKFSSSLHSAARLNNAFTQTSSNVHQCTGNHHPTYINTQNSGATTTGRTLTVSSPTVRGNPAAKCFWCTINLKIVIPVYRNYTKEQA